MGITGRNWREYPQRYRMEAAKCTKCGKIFFPPRLICSECKNREFNSIKISDEGTLKTYTVIRVGPTNFVDEVPYAVGIVELNDGLSTMMQVTDCEPEELSIGIFFLRCPSSINLHAFISSFQIALIESFDKEEIDFFMLSMTSASRSGCKIDMPFSILNEPIFFAILARSSTRSAIFRSISSIKSRNLLILSKL